MSSASMRLNKDHLPPCAIDVQHHWRYGESSNGVLQAIGLPIGRKEKAAILSMHQMAEVPIELLTDSILDQVFEGESLSEISINP